MVQNSVGRIYLDNNPYSDIKESMQYLVEPEEPTPSDAIFRFDDIHNLTCADLACGSGHILNESFDLLYDLYVNEGYCPSNAIKNTTEGSIVLKTAADDTQLTITVEDTGCGIAPEEADHIFERFVKLDDFKEGLGLGLPLCRMIAKRMGGNVILDTSYSPGARFIITLPLQEPIED